MKIEKTYKFPQFAKLVINPEIIEKLFTDENGVIHLEIIIISENPNLGVYLKNIENTDELEKQVIERLQQFEIELNQQPIVENQEDGIGGEV